MKGPASAVAALVGRGSKRVSRVGLYEFLDAEFARIERGMRVLSVGAGGEINDRLRERASLNEFELTQIDIDETRGPDVVGDIQTWRGASAFDVVVASEVLEHIPDPQAAVLNMHSLLRPGGRMLATVPFIFPIHGAPYDFFRYTRHGLEHLFRDFANVTIRTRSTWSEAFGVLAVRIARERGRRALELLVVPTVLAINPLLRAVGNLLPSEIITTGYTVVATRQ